MIKPARWSNRELIKTAQLNETFSGVTLHQIKLHLLHSLRYCAAAMKFTLVNILKCCPSWQSRNGKIFGTRNWSNFTFSEFDKVLSDFEPFVNGVRFQKISAQMKFNTCCHTIIYCTLPFKSSTQFNRTRFRSLRLWCVRVFAKMKDSILKA